MTHAELAARIAERFIPEQDRAEYSAALVRALDNRKHNKCDCNGAVAAEVDEGGVRWGDVPSIVGTVQAVTSGLAETGVGSQSLSLREAR